MICDFCRHEVVVVDARELIIPAWCPNCGAFSDGKRPAKMKLPNLVPSVLVVEDKSTSEVALELAEKFYEDMCNRLVGLDGGVLSKNEVMRPFIYHLALFLKSQIAAAGVYHETAKNAQEAGTKLWNTVVHVKNLLRVAQPYLEQDNMRCPDELELAALCNQIEKEIGSLEDNTTAEDGRKVAERLGIDIEKWAEELRAKVDAASVPDYTSTVETHAAVGPCLCGVTHNEE